MELKVIKKLLLNIVFSLLVILSPYCCYAFDDGDFQYWNTETISWKIKGDWKVAVAEEFRFGNDASNFYYQHLDLGFSYSGLAKWMDIGFNYRHIFEEKDSKWKEENRPHLNATVKWKLSNFDFSNRGRFEYRNREDADNFWQYRNKLTIKMPFKLTRFKIQLYIADEIFVDFDKEELNRNRLYAGFKMRFSKHILGEVYYLLQSTENNKWKDYNILGASLKLEF